jgi:hypothetical protein
MSAPTGFTHTQRADGTVLIVHNGRPAATLRGARAAKFLDEIHHGDPQHVCARWTGAYKFGNERTARQHPRNQRR